MHTFKISNNLIDVANIKLSRTIRF